MLQKLGEQLQQARQARGVSLEDAERIIRIHRKYLAALERGDHLALPTPLQVRGFLQSYSTYLGLDAAALVRSWICRWRLPAAPTAGRCVALRLAGPGRHWWRALAGAACREH